MPAPGAHRGDTRKPRQSRADQFTPRPLYPQWFAKVGWVMDHPQAEGRLEVLEQARREQEAQCKS
jgi:Zn-dependent protease with chaperone function